MTRFLDTLPHPWTRENIEVAIFKNFTDARGAIEETDGGRLWKSLSDLQDSLWIFQSNTTALLDEIAVFGDRSLDTEFWEHVNAHRADAHTRAVKKHIFNCTSSIMALVDHARAFQNSYPVDGYTDRLVQTFPRPGLHSFLQCFRNYNTHWRVAEANWSIHKDFETGKSDACFVVSRAELLRWDGWSSDAQKYLAAAPKKINVYEVFSEYRKLVQKFYSWHRGAVLSQYSDKYRPYLEYKRLYDGLQRKYHWNMILSHAAKALNPYEYVGRYLHKRQLETLLAIDHRSEDQVDALIQMLGMVDFCDAALREKAIALFRGNRDEV